MRILSVTKTAAVDCLAFSFDGFRIAAACKKANVRVWDSGSGKPTFNLKGTKDEQFVSFTADPDQVVVSSWHTVPTVEPAHQDVPRAQPGVAVPLGRHPLTGRRGSRRPKI